jgi:hypothetical protein
MCTIGCAYLDNTYIFKNRDPIRGSPMDELIENISINGTAILIIRNNIGCYGGINSKGVSIVGTFVNILPNQNNYFNNDNLISILSQGKINNIIKYLLENSKKYYGNIICSDGDISYAIELCGDIVNCQQINKKYIMTNHFQNIDKKIQTINDPFIAKWTYSRLTRGVELINSASTLNDVEMLLSDHNDSPEYSICNHGKIQTASSYIFDCTNKIVYYCKGFPCENKYIVHKI